MKVIFVAPKSNIPGKLSTKLKKYAKIYFFEDDPIDIRDIELLKEKGDKILCPFPEPMAWKFPSQYIKEIPDLKAICLSTTSFQWIDGKFAKSLGIHLTNVPNPPNGVAEGAIFMMFALAKRYAYWFKKKKKLEYKPENFLKEVKGKMMGIVGLGRIGSRIAELGKALGMQVVYWSKKTRNKKYQYLSWQKLLKTADFIFPAIISNKKTENFISKEKIDLIKPAGSLINIAHSGVLDLDYLIKKAEREEIFGLAFESNEKNIKDFKGNVFVTKYNNWYTKETLDKKMEIWIDNIISVIKGKPNNLVN